MSLSAITKRTNGTNVITPHREVVNLFQGISFCSHCGGRLHVATKDREINKERYVQNSPKIKAEFQYIFCDNASEKKNKKNNNRCPAIYSAPYIQKHNGIDNELKILNKIATFRWADFFTNERHDEELKLLKEKRMRLLNERNQIDEKLSKLKRSRARAWEEDEIVEEDLKKLIKVREEEFETAETSYKRSILDIQNLERKKTGQQLEVDIQKRVKTFIKKERSIPAKRREFNIFLKDAGIALEAEILKKESVEVDHYKFDIDAATVYGENYKFGIGIGMYDHKGKYRGLNNVEDDAVAFGLDLNQIRVDEAKAEESYKKQSLEVGRDVRFPSKKKRDTSKWKKLEIKKKAQ
ncbi:hypothetical protein [Prochlorococcus sp. MIT 1011]|uniref:hypothetical protein n=1 Tax=Prochlorococcus sp. MIT 1011 TaxID=3082520 RepID=UPI0039B5B1EA